MNKGHKATARTMARLFVNQTHACRSEPGEGGANVVHSHCDMMNSRPSFFKEARNRRVLRRSLKQFYLRFANRQHGDADLLFSDFLKFRSVLRQVEAQHVAIELDRLRDSSRRNSDVIDLHFNLSAPALINSSTAE